MTMRMVLPDDATVDRLTDEIQAWLTDVEREHGAVDVRVYLTHAPGWGTVGWRWRGCWGDASYDQDHRGYCGASAVDKDSDFRYIAMDLLGQGLDMAVDDGAVEFTPGME